MIIYLSPIPHAFVAIVISHHVFSFLKVQTLSKLHLFGNKPTVFCIILVLVCVCHSQKSLGHMSKLNIHVIFITIFRSYVKIKHSHDLYYIILAY